jgi:hypothetical protein
MKIVKWFSTVSLIISVSVGAYRLYRMWQESQEEENPSLTS